MGDLGFAIAAQACAKGRGIKYMENRVCPDCRTLIFKARQPVEEFGITCHTMLHLNMKPSGA